MWAVREQLRQRLLNLWKFAQLGAVKTDRIGFWRFCQSALARILKDFGLLVSISRCEELIGASLGDAD